MTDKLLLKNITHLYAEKMTNKNITQIDLCSFIYEFYIVKYGLKQVAESKFLLLAVAVMTFKDNSPRVKVFGRLLGLIGETHDLESQIYLECLAIVENETDERLKLPHRNDYDPAMYIPLAQAMICT
jgi:hypothetical protein